MMGAPAHGRTSSPAAHPGDAVSAWLEPLRRRLLISLIYSLSLTLFLILCIAPTNTMDDWGISFYLSGRSPGLDTSLFINALLGRLIFLLNSALPDANWFFVIEHLSAFLAFWALCFAALSYVPLGAGLAAVGFYSAFVLPLCTASSNFTVVSGICTSVGLLYLALQAYSSKAGAGAGCIGAVLFVFGMLWRQNMFLASLPFLAVAGLWWLGEELRSHAPLRRILLGIAPVIAAFAACAILTFCHVSIWQRADLASWYRYNEIRSEIVDHLELMPSYDEAASELEALGLSRNDYPFVITTMSLDLDAIPPEIHEGILALQRPLAIEPAGIGRALVSYLQGFAGRWKYAAAVILILILAVPHKRQRLLPMAVSVAGSIALCTYFVLWARLLERVETPVWCYGIVACIALAVFHEDEGGEENPPSPALTYVGIALGLAACIAAAGVCIKTHLPNFDIRSIPAAFSQKSYSPEGPMSDYLAAHEDSFYLVAAEQYDWLEREYGFRYLPDGSVSDRVACLIGWGVGSPYRRLQANRLGQANLVAALLSEENPALLIARRDIAEAVLTFLREHYDPDATCTLVDSVLDDGGNSACVWSFSGTVPEEGPHPAIPL